MVRYYETAAQGHETRRRILLLWGPPGGAKSSVAALLKRGLEQWTATHEVRDSDEAIWFTRHPDGCSEEHAEAPPSVARLA